MKSSHNCVMRQAFLAGHTSELGGGGGKWPKSLCVSRAASQGQTGSPACVLLGDRPRLGAGQDHHFLVCEMEVIILQGHCGHCPQSMKTLPAM